MKTCTRCGFTGDVSEFYADKSRPDGHRTRCKSCEKDYASAWRHKNPTKAKEQNRLWYSVNRDRKRKRDRLRAIKHYGLTIPQFETMLLAQNNSCGICHKPFTKTPVIDHNHTCCSSKKSCGYCVRGLLCGNCNLGLGKFSDSITTLEAAINYLRKYN